MTQPVDLAARFALDESKAAEWLASIVEIHDADGEPEDSDDPEFGATWEPAMDGDSIIDQLVFAATNNGVIVSPAGMELFFSCSDGEDGGSYCFLVDFGGDGVPRIRLSSLREEMRKIVGRELRGVDAAMSILREAVGQANHEVDRLAAFVAAQS